MSEKQMSQNTAPSSKEGSGRFVQEKIMLALSLIFFLGWAALTFVPSPFNGPAMGLIVFLTVFAMYRFN